MTTRNLDIHIKKEGDPFSDSEFPLFFVNDHRILTKVVFSEREIFNLSSSSAHQVISLFIDDKIIFFPLIDENKKLIRIFKKPHFLTFKKRVEVVSTSPTKIGLSGGGSDFTDYFTMGNHGHVINCAINLHSKCELSTRNEKSVVISNINSNEQIKAESISGLGNYHQIGLISAILNLLSPDFGFNLNLSTDFPIGSGLGGSTSITLSILAAFNELQEEKWSKLELVQLAFLCERIIFNSSGGWQDQYAIALGGIHEIIFKEDHHVVNKISLPKSTIQDLEDRLIICYSNISRNSGRVLDAQRKELSKNKILLDAISNSKSLVSKMIKELEESDFENFAKSLSESGKAKQSYTCNTQNSELEKISTEAKKNGVIAEKLLGAGSGGHILFMVDKQNKDKVLQELNLLGYPSRAFKIDQEGITITVS